MEAVRSSTPFVVVCVALVFFVLVTIAFWRREAFRLLPTRTSSDADLETTLDVIDRITKTESFYDASQDLYASSAAQALVSASVAPLNTLIANSTQFRCYTFPDTIPKFIDNVRRAMVAGFRQRVTNVAATTAANNLWSASPTFANVALICFQLDLMQRGRPNGLQVSTDAGGTRFVLLDEETQNLLILNMFNVLVDQPNMGATGEYMSILINVEKQNIDSFFFRNTKFTCTSVVNGIRQQITQPLSGDWIAQDEAVAKALQTASARPMPVSLLGVLVVMSMYTTTRTFQCSNATPGA